MPGNVIGVYFSELVCMCCEHVVWDPVECEGADCFKLFCRSCINDVAEAKCPHCQTTNLANPDKPIHPIHQKLLSQIQYTCQCGLKISYSDNESHQCVRRVPCCPLCRKVTLTMDSLKSHLENECVNTYFYCKICGKNG